MSVKKAVFALLSGHAGLTALVGTRIHRQLLPQEPTYPAVVYTRTASVLVASLGRESGLWRSTISVDCLAETESGAEAVALQVRDALDHQSGLIGWPVNASPYAGQLQIQAIAHLDSTDNYDDELEIHAVTEDFEVWHE